MIGKLDILLRLTAALSLQRLALYSTRSLVALLLAGSSLSLTSWAATPAPDLVIEAKSHQLGKRSKQDKDSGPRLELPFRSAANAREFTLQLSHRGVIQPWFVELNGRRIGQLPVSYNTERQSYFSVPAGALSNGLNTLSLLSEEFGRDITVGNCLLFGQPLRSLLSLRSLSLSVADAQSGKALPARICILDAQGQGAPLFQPSNTNAAMRTGLLYSSGEPLSLQLPAGTYEVYATRGMEWSLAHKSITLSANAPAALSLQLSRQVDTKGFIAADTHIHTLTFSGHGDASVQERMLSLAGEGVELAVATDHNHVTDYTPYQQRLGLNPFFTPVAGNEVTTKNGHINSFPFTPGSPLPDFHETNWVKLVADIRLKGAKVVILNHPRWPDPESNPLTRFGFNRATGDRFNGPAFTFDAMELVNSSSASFIGRPELKADPTRLLADWFAIQNRGEKIIGVGASDSHTLDNPVGQGRTYIRSSTDEPAHLNIDELCEHFLAGETTVSYGIFCDLTVNERFHMGQKLSAPASSKLAVSLRVAAPDWISPRRAIVFLNGLAVAEQKLEPTPGKAFEQRLSFSVEVPKHDAYLVCAVFGDPVKAPYWETLGAFTAAVSNPLYIDADGDGHYQSARTSAQRLLAATDGSLASLWQALEQADDALAGQMLGLLYTKGEAKLLAPLGAKLRAGASKRSLYQTFLESAPESK